MPLSDKVFLVILITAVILAVLAMFNVIITLVYYILFLAIAIGGLFIVLFVNNKNEKL